MALLPPNRSELAQYYNSTLYSDVVVEFSGNRIYAHRLVLANASEYFKSMFESRFKEATSHVIELHGDPPEAVRSMIRYCYTHIQGYDPIKDDERDTALLHLVDLYITAGKYLMPDLRQLAVVRFVRYTRLPFEPIETHRAILPDFDAPRSRPADQKLPAWFGKIARSVCDAGEPAAELRKSLVAHLGRNITTLRNDASFKMLLVGLPEFSFEVLGKVANAYALVTAGAPCHSNPRGRRAVPAMRPLPAG